jgi:hypothetical protein
MRYETPELTASVPAIDAIQSSSDNTPKSNTPQLDTSSKEGSAGYVDWED